MEGVHKSTRILPTRISPAAVGLNFDSMREKVLIGFHGIRVENTLNRTKFESDGIKI